MFCHGIEFHKFYVVYFDKLNLLDLTISNQCHEQTRKEWKLFVVLKHLNCAAVYFRRELYFANFLAVKKSHKNLP